LTDKEHAGLIKKKISELNLAINAAQEAGLVVQVFRPVFTSIIRIVA